MQDTLITISSIILIYFISLNIITTFRLIKFKDYYTKQQKFYQILVIWIVPILGVLLVAYLLNDRQEENKLSDSHRVPSRAFRLFALAFIITYNTSSNEGGDSSNSFSAGDSSSGGGGE